MTKADNRSPTKKDLPAPTATEPLWTVEDVANYLRLRPETVRMMARGGKLPSRKVGRSWRFSSKEIHNWVINKAQ